MQFQTLSTFLFVFMSVFSTAHGVDITFFTGENCGGASELHTISGCGDCVAPEFEAASWSITNDVPTHMPWNVFSTNDCTFGTVIEAGSGPTSCSSTVESIRAFQVPCL